MLVIYLGCQDLGGKCDVRPLWPGSPYMPTRSVVVVVVAIKLKIKHCHRPRLSNDFLSQPCLGTCGSQTHASKSV